MYRRSKVDPFKDNNLCCLGRFHTSCHQYHFDLSHYPYNYSNNFHQLGSYRSKNCLIRMMLYEPVECIYNAIMVQSTVNAHGYPNANSVVYNIIPENCVIPAPN